MHLPANAIVRSYVRNPMVLPMKLLLPAFAAATAITVLTAVPASAEVLLIKAISQEPANAPGALPRPSKGMRMDAVQQRFGAPKARSGPVGTSGNPHQPPITRWDYPNFSVYFENDQVITSVVHR